MKTKSLVLVAVLGALLPMIWGCEPSSPGQLYPNTPPETRIVVAPMPNASNDHYVSPEVMFRVQWFGHDGDGLVVGYWLVVDADSVWTTRGDSAIAFVSSQPDPNVPGQTLPASHTIRVTAVDDAGAADPTPATRTFSATNSIPKITEFVSDFADESTVGAGLSFNVTYEDSNPSGVFFKLWIDSQAVSDWDSRSAFQFCKTSDPTILNSVDSGAVKPLDVSLLPAGSHFLTLRVMDWGGAVSDSVTRPITVIDSLKPVISTLSSTYSGLDYYPDGSVFFAANAITHFASTASAAAYFGAIHSYRFRLIGVDDSTDWSPWGVSSNDTLGLTPGTYRAEVESRDWTGTISEPRSYRMTIIEPTFGNDPVTKLMVVDETLNGNGNRSSPNDFQADSTWRAILGYDTTSWTTPQGWKVTELDYGLHKIDGISYISPLDLFDKQVVIWHADDKATLDLNTGVFNKRALGEYLDRGGRLFICGWDVGANFGTGDSISFSASSFAGKYLRITGGKRTLDRAFSQATGDNGYANISNDPAKLVASWNGKLDRCWTFTPSHRSDPIARWTGVPFDGMTCAVKNFSPLNPWRTIICGFPVYFLDTASGPFVRKAIEELATD